MSRPLSPLETERPKQVLTIEPEATARDAAAHMREHHVGFLVVVEHDKVVGVVTDRDVALGVLARSRDPGTCTVAELMTHPAVTLAEGASAAEASRTMRERGVRKLPIVDADGRPVDVVTADDLILAAGARIHALARTVQRELHNEAHPTEPSTSVFGKE